MSHFPRYGIEDIANTEPGYEIRIADNVVPAATNDVTANQKFLHLKIPHFSSNGVAAVKAGLWMRWMLLRSLSASSPNQSPLPASSGTLFATSFAAASCRAHRVATVQSLSWRHLLVFEPLSDGQVWTSERHGVQRTRRIFREELFWFDDA